MQNSEVQRQAEARFLQTLEANRKKTEDKLRAAEGRWAAAERRARALEEQRLAAEEEKRRREQEREEQRRVAYSEAQRREADRVAEVGCVLVCLATLAIQAISRWPTTVLKAARRPTGSHSSESSTPLLQIQRKQASKEEELVALQRQREAEALRLALERRLLLKHKAETVEEMKRREAWEREQALRRIEEETARSKALLAQRTAIQVGYVVEEVGVTLLREGALVSLLCTAAPNTLSSLTQMQQKRRQANMELSAQRQKISERIAKMFAKGDWEKTLAQGISIDALLQN